MKTAVADPLRPLLSLSLHFKGIRRKETWMFGELKQIHQKAAVHKSKQAHKGEQRGSKGGKKGRSQKISKFWGNKSGNKL